MLNDSSRSMSATRFIKYVVAVLILWQIITRTSYFFFDVALSVGEDSQVVPEEVVTHEDTKTPAHEQTQVQHESTNEEKETEKEKDYETEVEPANLHHYHEDGFLEVNPKGRHPILELMERAESEWSEKLKRASKSLVEAVKEYKRRYKRYPPKGFDKWWDYVQKHNVQLPDEYDQIYHDLEPFWGFKSSELLKIQEELEAKKDSYTIGKNESSGIEILYTSFYEGHEQLLWNSQPVIDLLREVEVNLPPFRATFSPHDGPNRLSDFAVWDTALEGVQAGGNLDRESLPKPSSLGWLSACSPKSAARTLPDIYIQKASGRLNLDSPIPPFTNNPAFPYSSSASFRHPNVFANTSHTKTFIYDHTRTMDPCHNPALFWTHGQFLEHREGPAPQPHLIPEFAPCKTTLHHNIVFPFLYLWVDDLAEPDNPDWELREDDRLLWRGTNTGISHGQGTRWKNSHRDWLVQCATGVSGTVDVIFSDDDVVTGVPKTMRRARLNPSMLDVSFAGTLQCSDDETCMTLDQLFFAPKKMTLKEAGNYKYVMDVDGNGWSGRFKRLVTSKALVFKSTVYPEWYSARIQPWLHYVPVQVDLSDLYDALIFFRGDPNGIGAHDQLARRIALQGREWSKSFWRKEDLVAYFYRLMLEYARVMSSDRESMSYNP